MQAHLSGPFGLQCVTGSHGMLARLLYSSAKPAQWFTHATMVPIALWGSAAFPLAASGAGKFNSCQRVVNPFGTFYAKAVTMWYNYVLEIDVNAACNLPQAYFDGLVGKAGGVPVGDGTDFVAVDGVQIARTYAWEWCILGNGNNRAKLETQIHGAQIALASIPGVSVVLHRLTENL